MAIDHLFSIPIGKYELPNYQEVRDKLLPLLEDDYFDADDTNRKQDDWYCNSFQTWLWGNGQEKLVESLYPLVDDYLLHHKFAPFSYDIESWFNIYGKQQYQDTHSHQESLLSGIVVLNYDKEQHTDLHIMNPWREYAREFEKYKLTAYNMSFIYDSTSLNMENGYVYMWPSTLQHRVPPQPNSLKDLRTTFTFNVKPITLNSTIQNKRNPVIK